MLRSLIPVKCTSWLKRNFPLLAMMVWAFCGVTVAYALVSSTLLIRSWVLKLPAMIATGVVFGWVGFRLAIVIKEKAEIEG